jgi:hypothetical protein
MRECHGMPQNDTDTSSQARLTSPGESRLNSVLLFLGELLAVRDQTERPFPIIFFSSTCMEADAAMCSIRVIRVIRGNCSSCFLSSNRAVATRVVRQSCATSDDRLAPARQGGTIAPGERIVVPSRVLGASRVALVHQSGRRHLAGLISIARSWVEPCLACSSPSIRKVYPPNPHDPRNPRCSPFVCGGRPVGRADCCRSEACSWGRSVC